jgi:hypothetical protein
MFFEPQNKKKKKKKDKQNKEEWYFVSNFVFRPFTSNNYILFISHSFWTISKVTNALS